jgi:hypothetical protein
VYIIPGWGQPSDPSGNVCALASMIFTADGSTPRRAAASATMGSLIVAGSEVPPLIPGSPEPSESGAEGPIWPEPPPPPLAEQAASTTSAANRAKEGRSTA